MTDSLLTRLARVVVPTYKTDLTPVVSPISSLAPMPESTASFGPTAETKSSTSLLPRGAYGQVYEFFSPDGGTTIIPTNGLTGQSLVFAAYWYVATRWRAQKIAEAPLMVVKESQKDGSDEWIQDHELVDILDEPSLDFDMGELLERTSHYLDNSAECIWVMDKDRVGRVAHIMPFSGWEFTPSGDATRLYANFSVQTSEGSKDFSADQVCYFRDACDFERWRTQVSRPRSRLDVAMSWLRLGEDSRTTIRDLLKNAVWPSAVVIPDKDWNPDKPLLDEYKMELENYAAPGQRGKPFVQLGGGSFVKLAMSIKDLVPTDVLNRVESVIAAISGVPAIVLQFQIGLENAPWSQMAEARRMAYDDTIHPVWSKMSRVLTRQMLRPIDEDPTHFIRFDSSKIAALQDDRNEGAAFAAIVSRIATVNERRKIVGLEPVNDPKADLIPELQPLPVVGMVDPNADPKKDPNANDPTKDPKATRENAKDPNAQANAKDPKAKKGMYYAPTHPVIQRKMKAASLVQSFRQEAIGVWEVTADHLLHDDKTAIIDIVQAFLTDTIHKSMGSKARGKDRVMNAVNDYLKNELKVAWTKKTTPLMVQGAERSTAVTASDLIINYNILHPNSIRFAQKEVGKLITSVTKTTRTFVNDVISGGLEENRTTAEIVQLLQEGGGFSKARARLIARTETTTIFNGAPIESLSEFGKTTGRSFLKTWFGVMDEKERDEHVEMEGETVGIDEDFSNGFPYPCEPNCRCMTLTHEEEE
jgi:SPP1 gp7 family putative phage head morphogenesis protein